MKYYNCTGIMSSYDLLEHFADTDDPQMLKKHKALNDGSNYVAKDVFRDKRLNKLWAKAEMAGFTRTYVFSYTVFICFLVKLWKKSDAINDIL